MIGGLTATEQSALDQWLDADACEDEDDDEYDEDERADYERDLAYDYDDYDEPKEW